MLSGLTWEWDTFYQDHLEEQNRLHSVLLTTDNFIHTILQNYKKLNENSPLAVFSSNIKCVVDNVIKYV